MVAVGVIVAFIQSTAAIFPRRDALREGAERGCTQGDQQACQEMYATVRAANAADDIVDLAIWQFVAGLVGVYLIARTLQATRDAVREANEATQAARDAVRVTDDGNRRQLRAYMTWHSAELLPITKVDVGARTLRFDLKWKNTGQTPAKVLFGYMAWDDLPGDLPGDFAFPAPSERITSTIGAGKTVDTSAHGTVTPDIMRMAANGERRVFVWSAIEYEDIFEVEHRSEIAFEVSFTAVTTGYHVLFTPLNRHNAHR